MKTKQFVPFLLVTMILLLAAGCSTAPAAPTTEPPPTAQPAINTGIQGIVWQWQTLNDVAAGTSMRVDGASKYTIVFNTDGTTKGQADCNTFS